MKAVILAAGEGRRLEPLTEVRPKPMLPVANRPLLEYVVEAVAEAGLDEVVLVVGYKRDRIQSHFGDGDDWGVDIEYAVQDKQLGTGHAILQAEPYVDGPFLVLNGDRILEAGVIERMLEAGGDDAVVAVTRSDQPSDYGVVEVDGDRITSITEKPPASAAASDIINAGVYRFDPAVFDVIRAVETRGELTVTSTLERLIEDGSVAAVRYDGLWLDVSYLWDYLAVNAAVLDRGEGSGRPTEAHDYAAVSPRTVIGTDTTVQAHATVRPGTALGDNVSVGPNAVVENAVVLSDATVGAGAVLRDCIVGENAVVGPNTTIEGGHASIYVEGVVHDDVRLGGVVGDNARLGGAVTVAPGAVVGTDVEVEGGSYLFDRIESGSTVRRG